LASPLHPQASITASLVVPASSVQNHVEGDFGGKKQMKRLSVSKESLPRKPKARFKIGDHCICKHPYAFRGEAPFRIVAKGVLKAADNVSRWAYIVQYDSDGKLDGIPIQNEGGYEMERISDAPMF
jgi:hypothetical protein